ncbi:hypothetical protein BDF22DRAFT_678940 [Syncephalis plumigaleata]|nr:hypothetical protein BDF22DRAFT_678940 [Syncephalis plumigaleata]
MISKGQLMISVAISAILLSTADAMTFLGSPFDQINALGQPGLIVKRQVKEIGTVIYGEGLINGLSYDVICDRNPRQNSNNNIIKYYDTVFKVEGEQSIMKGIQYPFQGFGRKLTHDGNVCWLVHYRCSKTIKDRLAEIASIPIGTTEAEKQAAHQEKIKQVNESLRSSSQTGWLYQGKISNICANNDGQFVLRNFDNAVDMMTSRLPTNVLKEKYTNILKDTLMYMSSIFQANNDRNTIKPLPTLQQ